MSAYNVIRHAQLVPKEIKRHLNPFCGKKLTFMAAWINSEVEQSEGSVNEILKTLSNIVEQFK